MDIGPRKNTDSDLGWRDDRGREGEKERGGKEEEGRPHVSEAFDLCSKPDPLNRGEEEGWRREERGGEERGEEEGRGCGEDERGVVKYNGLKWRKKRKN